MSERYGYDVASVSELLKFVDKVTPEEFHEETLRILRNHSERPVSSHVYDHLMDVCSAAISRHYKEEKS